jgi:hypothetical protein
MHVPADTLIPHLCPSSQLRDLIICPREPGLVNYVHDYSIVEHDLYAPDTVRTPHRPPAGSSHSSPPRPSGALQTSRSSQTPSPPFRSPGLTRPSSPQVARRQKSTFPSTSLPRDPKGEETRALGYVATVPFGSTTGSSTARSTTLSCSAH